MSALESAVRKAKDTLDRLRGAYEAAPSDASLAAMKDAQAKHAKASADLAAANAPPPPVDDHTRRVNEYKRKQDAEARLASLPSRRPDLASEDLLEATTSFAQAIGNYLAAVAANRVLDVEEVEALHVLHGAALEVGASQSPQQRNVAARAERRRWEAVMRVVRAFRAGLPGGTDLPNRSALGWLTDVMNVWQRTPDVAPSPAAMGLSIEPDSGDTKRARRLAKK